MYRVLMAELLNGHDGRGYSAYYDMDYLDLIVIFFIRFGMHPKQKWMEICGS